MPEADPVARLRKLLIEAEKQRQAIHEYERTPYPEKVEQHATRLAALYDEIRSHCREHKLQIPKSVPPEEPA
jgi:hypothetical protein